MNEYERGLLFIHDRMEEPEPDRHYCPLCGDECEKFYKDKDSGEVIGCENCVEEVIL